MVEAREEEHTNQPPHGSPRCLAAGHDLLGGDVEPCPDAALRVGIQCPHHT